ncbi:hypothetical protein QQZ08_003022 [Neonectria magnoliae]|uniref:Lysine-specific metallo-endopeptidase domain-containing protein n=1 Tax=Neonectria magnoliae TaxID=2732573 RepID=A0ABR1ICD3_9HYPO
MRLSFLVGLFAGLGQAIDIYTTWEVDSHCRGKGAALDKAYKDSAVIVAKVVQDLQTIQKPRPARPTRSNIEEIKEWDRVARAVTNMFGFVPDQAGHSPTETHMAAVLYVFNRMNQALQGSQNVPTNGYAGIYYKPLIMCGPGAWRWISRDSQDPNDRDERPLGVSKAALLGAADGAWVYGTRYIVNGDESHVGPCKSPATYAVTMTRWDLVTFCDLSFSDTVAGTKSLVDNKNAFKEGDKLDDFAQPSLQRIMIHEFAHYYGADGLGTPDDRKVDDVQAVSSNGELVWKGADGKGTIQRPAQDPDIAVSYGYVRISRLAVAHTGINAANSGPLRATFNAENFAYFAIMA